MTTQYRCKNQRRLTDLIQSTLHPPLNGIDFLEVSDAQRTLTVHFVRDLPTTLTASNVAITGGVRVKAAPLGVAGADSQHMVSDDVLRVVAVHPAGKVLTVTVNKPGDFSTYTLRLITSPTVLQPPDGFDLQLSAVDFSFKVDCPSDFDCAPATECPPPKLAEPAINYLAKDYASFRRLMLDRLSLLMPAWRERNPADLQVALVELLAYVGDYLSYFQDAVASEAYLGTARKRISVHRHARLLDYPMHDGCNARVWVAIQVESDADGQVLPGPTSPGQPGTRLLTQINAPRGRLSTAQWTAALNEDPQVFETMHDLTLYAAHNTLHFYTWGDEQCCLPRGATAAFLRDDAAHRLRLRPGDVLIFTEQVSPTTGLAADADPAHRHPVRLTAVKPAARLERNAAGKFVRMPGPLATDPLTGAGYVEIQWDVQDALPFPLCLSALVGGELKTDLGVALGNVVLADHGRTIELSDPRAQLDPVPDAGPYRPHLKAGPLTQQGQVRITQHSHLAPLDLTASAAAAFLWEMQYVRPAVTVLAKNSEDRPWRPQRDLLGSDRFAREFVVEIGDEGQAQLRFGDEVLGQQPEPGIPLTAVYRVGNGQVGNIGRETLAHIITNVAGIGGVRNPLPAQGGVDPEPIERVKLYAPQAFRRQERAVTAADYAAMAERHPQVHKAAATIRWTGSWYTVFVTIDRKGGRPVDSAFQQELLDFLERYRMAGYDLEVNAPNFVPLDLTMTICVKPGYFKRAVQRELLSVLSNHDLSQGGQGFFHPDRFTFGQPLYLSQIYAAVMQVAGVAWVEATRFQRLGKAANAELDNKILTTGHLEVVRLDNDPNFPENGRLELNMEGGQ